MSRTKKPYSFFKKIYSSFPPFAKNGAGTKKRKTMISSRRYSTEEVIAAVMELDSDSFDSSDTFSSSLNEKFNPTPLEKNNPTPQTLSIPTQSSPKRYTQLQNVNSSPPSLESSAKSSTIHLEFSSSGNTPQSLSPQSDSTYGKYSTTDSMDSTSNTGSLNSSPTFPSDKSTESTNTPLFPDDTQNDTDSESSFADFNVEDINIPQSETVIKKKSCFTTQRNSLLSSNAMDPCILTQHRS